MSSYQQHPQENEETLSQVFCLNAIQMMYSLYFNSDSFPMQNYPQTNDSSVKETKFAFQSRVVDLKLRRSNERSLEIQDQFTESLQKENNCDNKKTQNEESKDNNIDDAFIEPPVERPKNYKYLTLAQKEEVLPKNTSKGIDFKKITKEQKIRLNNAREKGINRAKRRAEKMRGLVPNDYGQSNIPNNEKYYQRSENNDSNV